MRISHVEMVKNKRTHDRYIYIYIKCFFESCKTKLSDSYHVL